MEKERIRFELDPDMSLKEKGALLVCLELIKKGINPTIENIKQNGLDAERSIASAIHKLTELGYYRAIRYRQPDGPGFNWRYEVVETREV